MLKQEAIGVDFGDGLTGRLANYGLTFPKHAVIGAILMVALFAFEIFNFDTTRYALDNLLGHVSFAGLGWATILAIAFCAIDFAGLVRLFAPESDGEQPKEVWYLMGAWLLGATMNALMTWWAVSLTLLNHEFGNEVLSREQLLQAVPIFVAVLVWLTRILFIGAITMAGEHLLSFASHGSGGRRDLPRGRPVREKGRGHVALPTATVPHLSDKVPAFLDGRRSGQSNGSGSRPERPSRANGSRKPGLHKVKEENECERSPNGDGQPAPRRTNFSRRKKRTNGRVKQRPPMPGFSSGSHSARNNKQT